MDSSNGGFPSCFAMRLRRKDRSDWRSFEPYPKLIAPILTVFEGPALPFVATAEAWCAFATESDTRRIGS
ncbi:MAG: hypothetical protein GX608_12240 [Lentisphaerae bacterium]|nr:hypothetical protein [Lentisphaerota bacterium]